MNRHKSKCCIVGSQIGNDWGTLLGENWYWVWCYRLSLWLKMIWNWN